MLAARPSSFDLARLRAGLKPFRLHFFPRLGSTNDHASALRKRGELFAPAVVLTSHQVAGRGRGSNAWWSCAGCLTVTFVLPIDEQLQAHQIPLVAGLAVRDAVAQLAQRDDVLLKWPNDVMLGGRKLAGLLCERVQKVDLIGLGLNVNVDPRAAPGGLGKQITSLSHISTQSFDMTDVLVKIAANLRAHLTRRGERPFAQTLERYDAYHCLIGRRVTVAGLDSEPPVSGLCEGLDRFGRLILRSGGSKFRIVSGQIRCPSLDTRTIN